MPHGCGSFSVSCRWWSCSEFQGVLGCGRVAELAEVVAVVLAGDVPVPVGGGVAAGGDGAHPEHGLGAGQAPPGSGDAEAVADDVPAGALDDPGGDRPAVRECRRVVQVGFLGLQVVRGLADVLVVLPAGPRRVRGGPGRDAGGDAAAVAGQDVQAPGGDLVFGSAGIAGRGEGQGGFPQVPDDVDEVDEDGDVLAPGGGFGLEALDLVGIAVGQDEPVPFPGGIAAVRLGHDQGDDLGAAGGDAAGVPLVQGLGGAGRL